MARRPSAAKQREWEQRLRRFEKAGQSVSEFCLGEEVSPKSFYRWRQKLGGLPPRKADRHGRGTKSADQAQFQPVVVTARQQDIVGARIRLPNGVEIELGNDALVIEKLFAQLLHTSIGVDAC
jgi:hypothetical protein